MHAYDFSNLSGKSRFFPLSRALWLYPRFIEHYPIFQTDLRFSWMFDNTALTFKIINQYGVQMLSQKAISCWSEASLILAKDFCYKFGGSKTSACVIVFELSSRTICSAYALG